MRQKQERRAGRCLESESGASQSSQRAGDDPDRQEAMVSGLLTWRPCSPLRLGLGVWVCG